MTPPAYDLAPLAPIALLGVVLAGVPLLWLWHSRRGASPAQRRGALVNLALFLCFDLVLFGAYTRLSDSGLGCPDWPGCYGSASPLGAHTHIEAAQALQPSGPVTRPKAWVEMLHRYLAVGLGALITALALLQLRAWHRERTPARRAAAGWALATFAWVCLQGAFGALTVTWRLYPAIVTGHLLGGLGLLALLAAQGPGAAARLELPRRLRAGIAATFALLIVQVALGGWVSTNYAVLACSDFPTCQGAWWPPMVFGDGFTVLRELGQGPEGAALPFAALTAIHFTHRAFALLVLLALVALAWRLLRWQRGGGDPGVLRFAAALAGLALFQLASGVSNVVLGWPLLAALAHTGGAAALVIVLARLCTRMRPAPAAQLRHLPETVGARRLHHV